MKFYIMLYKIMIQGLFVLCCCLNQIKCLKYCPKYLLKFFPEELVEIYDVWNLKYFCLNQLLKCIQKKKLRQTLSKMLSELKCSLHYCKIPPEILHKIRHKIPPEKLPKILPEFSYQKYCQKHCLETTGNTYWNIAWNIATVRYKYWWKYC